MHYACYVVGHRILLESERSYLKFRLISAIEISNVFIEFGERLGLLEIDRVD